MGDSKNLLNVRPTTPMALSSGAASNRSLKSDLRREKESSISQYVDEGEEVDIEVQPENCSVVLPLDNSKTCLYVLYYYLKKIHKPDNFVHACFVSDDFVSARTNIKKGGNLGVKKESKCCRCFKGMGADRAVLDVGPSPGVLAELRKLDRVACMKVKHRVKHLFNKNGIKWDFRRLRGADPGKAILDYRNSIGGDIVIMGTCSRTFVGNIIYGSVSTKVLTHSLVPVLVIRRPQGVLESETINKETKIA